MKKTIGVLLVSMLVTATMFASEGKSEKSLYEVDTNASKVYWTGKKVSGEHFGNVSIGEGTVSVEGDKVVSADVKMDLNTIECTDLSGEWADKLIGHLKSDDFFSVEKYPHAGFKITSVKHDGDAHEVVGDLTIKGITNEVSFPAEIEVTGEKVVAKGTANIDRTRWDIKYGSGKFFQGLGDRMINDEFQIKFELVTGSAGLSSK